MSVRNLLVVGGAGALGRAVVSRFSSSGWKAFSVDFAENTEAASNILLNSEEAWPKQAKKISDDLAARNTTVGAVICTAGGWAGGNVSSLEDLDAVDQMWKVNVTSATTSAHLAATLLEENGLLVLTGAEPARKPTPGMIGYGMSKAATIHLAKSVAEEGLREGCTVTTIMPVTIDTPMNRKFMADADFSQWTKPSEIADKLLEWATNPSSRPPSGSLTSIFTNAGKTEWKTTN